jgi:SAM-dependent methyltransferase
MRHEPSFQAADALADVRRYYGEVLRATSDLKTSACCADDAVPPHVQALVAAVHPEIRERFYGCGLPLPPALDGCTVRDLGAARGATARAVRLAGRRARTGDRRRHDVRAARGGAGIASGTRSATDTRAPTSSCARLHRGSRGRPRRRGVDVCDLELRGQPLARQARVFSEIFRVLKPGGEALFSDVFADRRVARRAAGDPVLLGRCLAGALYHEDFRRHRRGGLRRRPRVVTSAPIALTDPAIERRIGMVTFRSRTIRAFKLALEDRCEDYGQTATYRGTVPELPHAFELDDHHRLETGRPMLVCGNTADMLACSRYASHFAIAGDKRTHFGLFDCAPAPAAVGPTGACC